jgi:hypothetical protein
MTETPKLQELLARLEEEFLVMLMPVLQKAATGHDAWLFVRAATAIQFGLGSRHSDQAETLASLANDIQGLREDLACSDPSCPAARYLQACEEAADLDEDNRLGPQRTAQNMMRDINKLAR